MVATVPVAFTAFMAPHIRRLGETQPVLLITSGGPEGVASLTGGNITFQSVPIARDISLLSDAKALFQLWRLLRRGRFDVVQSLTPKAGLLAMVAARAAGVPNRIHWFVGQVWATRRGVSRWLLKTADRITARSATRLLADSPSQRDFLAAQAVTRPGSVTVLGDGSVCGVDTARFRPDPDARDRIRTQLGIASDATVLLYLGRLNTDKGSPEMTEAYRRAAALVPALHLLAVGTDEENFRPWMRETLGELSSRLRFVDYTYQPEHFMAASDIFILPSHREGFGATVIEAAACAVPAVGTRIYGLIDAIAEGESGLLVPVRDVDALTDAVLRLARDEAERRAMGARARARVERLFSQARMVEALSAFYQDLPRG